MNPVAPASVYPVSKMRPGQPSNALPASSLVSAPVAMLPQAQPQWALNSLVAQLGVQTRMMLDGSVYFNEPLVQNIVGFREQALPALQSFFQSANSIPSLIEGLHVAGRLSETGVRQVESLYPSLVRWHSHPDPTVQIHLARFYRTINEPKTFGPLLTTMINQAVTHYPMQASPTFNVSAEVGETVLNQLARRTAEETIQRLVPALLAMSPPRQPGAFQPEPSRR